MTGNKTIKKRCDRCEMLFEIPNIKQSRARDLLLQFYPCAHCGYVKDIFFARFDRTGACVSCLIPFALVDHHGKGMCERCYRRSYRDKDIPV